MTCTGSNQVNSFSIFAPAKGQTAGKLAQN